jgi:uncharacterized repeat protein (TIGR01451 family)
MNKISTSDLILSAMFRWLSTIVLSLFILQFSDLSAQTVNKRLYLKPGDIMNRVQPTSTSFSSSPGLTKGTAAFVGTPVTAISGVNGTVGPYTTSYTISAGNDRMLIVGISSGNETPVTSVSYGSQQLTKLGQTVSTDVKTELWYLLMPAVGTATVSVNFSTTVAMRYAIGVVNLVNVDQGTPFGPFFSQNFATTTSVSYTVPSNLGDQIIDVVGVLATGGSQANFLPAATQTEVYRATNSKFRGGSSYRAGQLTNTGMSWSNPSTGPWSVLSVAVKGTANEVIFNQSPPMCSAFTIKAGTPITIRTHAAVTAGSCGSANLPYVAYLMRGTDTLVKQLTAVNVGLGGVGTQGTLTWTGTIAADYTLAPGGFLTLELTNDCINSTVRIDYDGTSKVSYVELPTSTYINVNSLAVYDAPYPSGNLVTEYVVNKPLYIRAVVSDPFGFNDITGLNVNITGPSSVSSTGTSVATAGCTRTYQYIWNPTSAGAHTIAVTALEGTEGTVTHSANAAFTLLKPEVTIQQRLLSPAVAPYTIGDTLRFELKVKNTGTTLLTNVPVIDQFSASCFQFVSAQPAANTIAPGFVSWANVGPIAPGDSIILTVRLRAINNCSAASNQILIQDAKDAYNVVLPTQNVQLLQAIELPPHAVNDNFCIQGSTALNVLANDTDADRAGFLTHYPGQYWVAIEQQPSIGTVVINPDQTIQFNPMGMIENQVVTFKYRVAENAYASFFDTATVTVLFSAVNDIPDAQDDYVVSTSELPVVIDVLANDTDPDGLLTVTQIVNGPTYGTAVIQPNGTVLYTPFADFTGTDVFTYQVCDNGCPLPTQCATAQVSVQVVFAWYVCKEGSSQVSVPAIPGATGYNWDLPVGAVVTAGFGTHELTVDWAGVTSGTYTICAEPENDCGPGANQCVQVVVNDIQAAILPSDITCFGSDNGFVDVTVSGGISPYSYQWTRNGQAIALNVESPTGLQPGAYQVTITDKYGCIATSAVVHIEQPASTLSLTSSVVNENPFGSSNGQIAVNVSGGTAPYLFAWTKAGDPFFYATQQNLTGLTGGTYLLSVTDANGCVLNRIFTVNRIGGPLAISYLAADNVLCFGGATGNVQLEIIGGTGNYTYQWFNMTDSLVVIATVQDLLNVVAGTYKVIVQDGVNPAIAAYINITQPVSGLSANAVPSPVTCFGAGNGAVMLNVGGGTTPYQYYWSNGAGTPNLQQLNPGNYQVTVRDANGCEVMTNAVVHQPSALVLDGEVVNTSCNSAGIGTIHLTVSGGNGPYAYLWSDGSSAQNRTDLAAGNYSVVVTDQNLCSVSKNFRVRQTCIAVQKTVLSTPINNGDGTYHLSYQIRIQNNGEASLVAMQLEDDLSAAFPAPASFSILSISSAKFNLNGSYDGINDIQLLGSGVELLPTEQGVINISLLVTPGLLTNPYTNYVSASAEDKDGVLVSSSANVPVSLIENPSLGLAKYINDGPFNNGDGTFDLSFTILARNYGDVVLNNVSISDNLDQSFGVGNYTVTGIVSDDLAVNPAFNGSSDTMLLTTGNTLARNQSKSVLINLTVSPSSPNIYFNQAFGAATGPGATTTTDASQHGSNPDPDGNGNPGDNSNPTPVLFPENPEVGLAKRLLGVPVNNFDGTYTLTYEFSIKNSGDVHLYNLQLTDDLGQTFPSRAFVVNQVQSTDLNVAFPGYDGISNLELLSGTDALLIGEIKKLTLTVTVTPGADLGPYLNSAEVAASSPFGTIVSTLSNDGLDPDPENDGPDDNDIPTPAGFTESPMIGLAKQVSGVLNNGDASYDVTYTIHVVNMGDVPLTQVQVTDHLTATFAGSQGFSVVSVSASAGLQVNLGYDGVSDINMLVPAGSSVAYDHVETITLVVRVLPGVKLGKYFNSASGSAIGLGGTLVSDVSQNGNDPDPDNDGNPTNNSVPTPVTFIEIPNINVHKVLSSQTNMGPATYEVAYEITVSNVGNVPLYQLQVVDDIATAYELAAGVGVTSVSVLQQPATTSVNVNPAYNGSSNIELLLGGDTLRVGETVKLAVTIVASFDSNSPGGPYINESAAFAVSPGGNLYVDVDTATANFFEEIELLLEKTFEGVSINPDGTQRVSFKLKIENLSNVLLGDLKIYDDVLTQFADLNPTDFQAEQGLSLLVNPNWNGSDTSNILASGQSFDLEIEDEYYVYISFNVTPQLVTERLNTAFASGTGPLGGVATDIDTATTYFIPPNIIDFEINGLCLDDTPYLNYEVVTNFNPIGLGLNVLWERSGIAVPDMLSGATPVDSVFNYIPVTASMVSLNGNGTFTVSGTILWPGAELDINNQIVDWPGWEFENGLWVFREDGYGQYRNGPSVSMTFNPTVQASGIAYPPATPSCNTEPPAAILSGNVFNDINGLIGAPVNTVDGQGINILTGNTPLFVNIVSNGVLLVSVPVNSDGSYQAVGVPYGDYVLELSVNTGNYNDPAPARALVPGWVNTGENIGAGAGNDGLIDGALLVNVGFSGVDQANFGINQLPVADTLTLFVQTNPLGVTPVLVPSSALGGIDYDGELSFLTITQFPTHVTTISIDQVIYTAANFPSTGVTVPTNNAGHPLVEVLIDPIDGNITVNIPFTVTDNAGFVSLQEGYLNMPFIFNTTNAVNDENSTWIATSVSGNVTTNDFDLEGNNQFFGSFLSSDRSADIASGSMVDGINAIGQVALNIGIITFDNSGNYTFTPEAGFIGVATIPYRICDNGIPVACDTALLEITVSPLTTIANSVIANNDEYFSIGNPIEGNLFHNDTDSQADLFSVTAYLLDSNGDGIPNQVGSLGLQQIVAGKDEGGNLMTNAGTLTIDFDGSIVFIPTPGFVGRVSLSYTICDVGIPTACDVANVTLTVLHDLNGPTNDPPFAGDDFIYTSINAAANGNFVGNDYDLNNDPISMNGVVILPNGPKTAIQTLPTIQGGSLTFFADGTFTYLPPLNYIGPDRVLYQICDVTIVEPQPLCSDATIHMLVGNGVEINGMVWQDPDGSVTINHGEQGSSAHTTLYVNVVDVLGRVVGVTEVNADGTYSLDQVPAAANLTLVLSLTQGVVGQGAPMPSLPTGWVNTGQNFDGQIIRNMLGILPFFSGTESLSNLDFGIELRPTATDFVVNTIYYANVDASIQNPMTVMPSYFITDDADGWVDSIRLVSFPSNILFISVGNATYTSANFPAEGITLSADSLGQPIGNISVVPDNLSQPIIVPFVSIDNANVASNLANITVTFSAILPVELLSFDVKKNGCTVELSWLTASEFNNDFFTVYRSMDAQNWEPIAKVAGNGTTSLSTKYSFVDQNPVSGMSYYRLKQTDYDGTEEWHPIRGIDRSDCGGVSARIYPNPATNVLNVALTDARPVEAFIALYNAAGALVLSSEMSGSNTHQLNISQLASGTYMLSIQTKEIITSFKVIVAR